MLVCLHALTLDQWVSHKLMKSNLSANVKDKRRVPLSRVWTGGPVYLNFSFRALKRFNCFLSFITHPMLRCHDHYKDQFRNRKYAYNN